MNDENIKNEILSKIKSGEIQMKSRRYFAFRLILLFITIFFVFILSVFLVSYILFSLRVSGQLALLGFGTKGLYHFLFAFPWVLLGVNIIFLLFLDLLLKTFEFGYKRPMLYLFVGTIVVIVGAGTLINMTSFHSKMLIRSEQQRPLLPGFYAGIRKSQKEAGNFRGFVRDIEGNTFILEYSPYDGGSSDVTRVIALPQTRLSDYLRVGDYVFVAGAVDKGEIRAFGIKKLVRDF